MEGFTGRELLIAILGSGGFIGGLVGLLSFLSSRIDKRRQRLDKEQHMHVSQSTDMRRFELDKENSVQQQLWKIIEEREAECKELETALKESTLSRPQILKIGKNIREMRKEIESLNVMILDEEQTNVFMRRFQTVKQLLDETEGMLP